MTHAEFNAECRKDLIFYLVALLFIALWIGYCLYESHERAAAVKACEVKGGRYLNTGFEKYGCYKLEEIK